MSDIAIRVDSLGKKYLITHQQRERYTALRDVIVNKARSLGGRTLHPGRRAVEGTRPDKEEFWALKNVSFEVKQGERIGIIGRNGAGKSTLLKLLSRITEPSTGRMELRGRVASLLEVGTGFHPELTGRENIYLNGAILGMGRAEIKQKFEEIVDFSEVEMFLDTPVKRYSSGMYVRLAFAVAAHLEPEILIVDEVLAVGDLQFQKKCIGKMESAGREGRTLLFVSHNVSAVNNLCNKGICLADGQIVKQGQVQDVVHYYMGCINTKKTQTDVLVDDSEMRISSYIVGDANGVTKQAFTTTDPIFVKICFTLKKPLPALRIGVDLLSMSDGEVIFRTFDDDQVARCRAVGTYVAVCSIPKNLLMPGAYLLSLQVGIHNVRWITNGEIIEKIFIENLDGVNSSYRDRRPGRIMPQVIWDESGEEQCSAGN
jgi:lipopolysaccharide transport system ATP-binding protein